MKAKSLVLSLMVGALALTSNAHAEKVGNGGISHVCRDDSGRIVSARILDLWEPESFVTFQDNSVSADEQLNRAIGKIESYDFESAKKIRATIENQKKIRLLSRKPLVLTNDAIPDYETEGKNCKFEQLARLGFVNELGRRALRVNLEIFNSPALSETDRAALDLHEALYDLSRDSDSRRTRKYVAILFSDQKLTYGNLKSIVDIASVRDSTPLWMDNTTLNIKVGGDPFQSAMHRGVCRYEVLKNDIQVFNGTIHVKKAKDRNKEERFSLEVAHEDVIQVRAFCDGPSLIFSLEPFLLGPALYNSGDINQSNAATFRVLMDPAQLD